MINLTMKIFIFFSALIVFNSFSQKLKYDLNHYMRFDTRFFKDVPDQYRFNYRQKYRVYYEFSDKLKIKSVLSTGSRFNSEWNNINLNSKNVYNISLRNLFADVNIGNVRIQIGSIPTFKEYKSPLNLDKNGWIDQGLRVEYEKGQTVFEGVLGRISSVDNPLSLSRFGKYNYAEIEVSTTFDKRLIFELGYEHFDQNFLKAEIRNKFEFLTNHVLKTTMQGLINVENGSSSGAIELQLKGKKNDNFISSFSFLSRLIYVATDLGARGNLIDEFSFPGAQLEARIDYDLKNKNTQIFMRNFYNFNNKADEFKTRFNIGFKHNLSNI